MRKMTFYCDRCGHMIVGTKYQLGTLFTTEQNPEEEEWELDKGADLCDFCLNEIDDMVAWMLKNPKAHFSSRPKETEEEPKKTNIKHGERPVKRVGAITDDMLGRIAALRNAGWSYQRIAEDVGVSHQTVANRMEEAQEYLKRQKEKQEEETEDESDDE